MRVFLDHVQAETEHVRTFWFRLEKRLDYIAGQFIELTVPHEHPDDSGTRRWFTLSSSPTDALVSITTRFSRGTGSSFKQALAVLQPGDSVQMSEAMGDFVLPKDRRIPLIFIASGIGVTPFHSMVRWLQATGEQRTVQAVYAATSASEVLFEPVFRQYVGAAVSIFAGQPTKSTTRETSRLSADRILGHIDVTDAARIYMAGPEAIITALYEDLRARGLKREQLLTDYFHGYIGS